MEPFRKKNIAKKELLIYKYTSIIVPHVLWHFKYTKKKLTQKEKEKNDDYIIAAASAT